MIVSIDIGTSYSSICMLGPNGKVQPVDISTGASMYGSRYALPTAVFVDESGKILVGQAAMNNRKRELHNFCMEFKRNLGEDIPITLGERSFRPEELYTELFRYMKTCAKKAGGEPIEKVYLTYPASYGEHRKEKLCAAAKAAGLFDIELVVESTAVAMCYCAEGYIQDGQILLVYDFGGGTFDVSLIRYKDGNFELLAEPEGLEQCGGIDMDRLIFQDMIANIEPDIPKELRENKPCCMSFTNQLEELAVKAKHHLTIAEVFEEDIQIGFNMVGYHLTVGQFNEMIAPLVGQTIQACRRVMKEAGLEASEISAVLMAGGTSRVPLVQEMARRISEEAKQLCVADLELVVAQGALAYQTLIAGKTPTKNRPRDELVLAREYYWKGLTKRGKRAIGYYLQAVSKKYGPAAYQLCYADKEHIDKWEDKVIKWCLKNAEKMDPEAASVLGTCYFEGKYGVEKDERRADQWCHQAVLWKEELANQGNIEYIRDMGVIYRDGKGVAKDVFQAIRWFRKGVELKDGKSARMLGCMYKAGDGVSQDYGKAVRWFHKGVELGDSRSAWQLGYMYRDGIGVPQDYGNAVQWYCKGAAMGDGDCAWHLARCYECGRGVSRSHTQALQWLQRAVELGNSLGTWAMGKTYYWGSGDKSNCMEKNYNLAAQWFRIGAETEDRLCYLCMEELGKCYEEGIGVPKDSAKAIEWHKKVVKWRGSQ